MGRYSIRAAALAAAVLVAVCAPGARAASTAVTGLTAAQPVTNIAPSLHWNAFTGATAYRVVRDGVLVGRVTAAGFTDSALSVSGVHSYSVRGVRADGSLTGASGVQVTYDTLAPASITSAPGGSRLTGTEPTISWPAVTDAGPAGIRQYNIRRDGVYLASVPASQLTFTDATAVEGTHGYSVRGGGQGREPGGRVLPRCADHGRSTTRTTSSSPRAGTRSASRRRRTAHCCAASGRPASACSPQRASATGRCTHRGRTSCSTGSCCPGASRPSHGASDRLRRGPEDAGCGAAVWGLECDCDVARAVDAVGRCDDPS